MIRIVNCIFKLRDRPVRGVRFHPEVDREAGEKMFAENLSADPTALACFADELGDSARRSTSAPSPPRVRWTA